MKIGIVGLPNVGKSTLFNALTEAGAGAENYPFCTIDPNIGVVNVPDHRLDNLYEMHQSEKKIATTIEFVDIAGLVKGASEGEGLGNKFLSHIREVDAIAHVVRCFDDKNVSHVDGSINPLRDIEIINTELIMADLATVEKRKEKVSWMLKSGEKEYKIKMEILERLIKKFEQGVSVRQLEFNDIEKKYLKELQLLTDKAVIYLANVAEDDILNEDNQMLQTVSNYAKEEEAVVIPISAKIEADIAELDAEESELFLEELGLEESGLDRVIRAGYKLLDLITFFTAGKPESRAWTVEKGSTAPEAAGKIHTDMQRGFIRAEVVSYEDLINSGSISEAREAGLLRLEGKDYIIVDGDVCHFRFNV